MSKSICDFVEFREDLARAIEPGITKRSRKEILKVLFDDIDKHIDARLAAAEHKAWCADVNADGSREHLVEVIAAGMVDRQWISVDERLPEGGVSVMVYSPPTQHDWTFGMFERGSSKDPT
jgi:hypothetical protein